MSVKAAIVRQFGRPSGLIGGLAGQIMARRSSNRIRNQRTLELMDLRPDSRVLEIGCGPGLALAHCAGSVTGGWIVGLDHSPVMIRQARQRLARAGVEHRVELVAGGVGRLDEWSRAFDRVFSLNVIQFIPDKPDLFRRVFQALDRGGQCFTTYQPRLDNEAPDGAARVADKVTQMMQDAGFHGIDRTRIDAGPAPAVCVFGVRPVE